MGLPGSRLGLRAPRSCAGLGLSVPCASLDAVRRGRPDGRPAPTRGCPAAGPDLEGRMTAQRLTDTHCARSRGRSPTTCCSPPPTRSRRPRARRRDGAGRRPGRPRRAGAGVPPRRPDQPAATARLGRGAGPRRRAATDALRQPVTLEPGGQIELSTPPAADVGLRGGRAARRQRRPARPAARGGLRRRCAREPTSPGRSARINPSPRYVAMEQHFDALGCAGSGQRDDDRDGRAPGQPRRRPGVAAGRTGSAWCARWSRCWWPRPSTSPWLGGDDDRLALDAPGHLAGHRPRAQRSGAAGGADRGLGDVRPGRAGDAGARRRRAAARHRADPLRPVAAGRRGRSVAGRRWPTSTTT